MSYTQSLFLPCWACGAHYRQAFLCCNVQVQQDPFSPPRRRSVLANSSKIGGPGVARRRTQRVVQPPLLSAKSGILPSEHCQKYRWQSVVVMVLIRSLLDLWTGLGQRQYNMGGGCSTASNVNVLDNLVVKEELKSCKLDEFEKGEVLGTVLYMATLILHHICRTV